MSLCVFNYCAGGGSRPISQRTIGEKIAILTALVIGLILVILAGFAAAGLFYPSSSLQGLGSALGPIGTLSTLGGSLISFAIATVLYFCSCTQDPEPEPTGHISIHRSPPPANQRETTGTGASGGVAPYGKGHHNQKGDDFYSDDDSNSDDSSS